MVDIVFPDEPVSATIGADELPLNVDLVIYRGDYKEFYVELQDDDGNTLDLSQFTAKAQLRKDYNDADALLFDTDIINNSVRVYLSSEVSTNLVADSYVWDLQLKSATGRVRTHLTGDVKIYSQVTV